MEKLKVYPSNIVSSSDNDSSDEEDSDSTSDVYGLMSKALKSAQSDSDSDTDSVSYTKSTEEQSEHQVNDENTSSHMQYNNSDLFFIDKSSKQKDDQNVGLSDERPFSKTSDAASSSNIMNELRIINSKRVQPFKQGMKPKRDNESERMQKAKQKGKLSTSLDDHLNRKDLYIQTDMCNHLLREKHRKKKSRKTDVATPKNQDTSVDLLMKRSVLPSDLERQHTIPPYEVSLNTQKVRRREERSKTKGKSWFNMMAPEMTAEKKNDLNVIRMRHILDPKRFYKRPDLKVIPKFFQMGKVVEDATEFYSARVPKKQQKKTLVEELLQDAEYKKFSKRKYGEIADMKHKRKTAAAKHMKRLKNKKR